MWKILYLSPYVVFTLLGNYMLDAMVILICFKMYQIKMKKEVLIRTLGMSWVLGITADLVALMIMVLLRPLLNENGIFDFGAVFMSGVFLFFLNRYLFLRVAISQKMAIKMAFIMSLVTSPWLFLIPTSAMY